MEKRGEMLKRASSKVMAFVFYTYHFLLGGVGAKRLWYSIVEDIRVFYKFVISTVIINTLLYNLKSR